MVSRVDGEAIDAAELVRFAGAAALSPEAALQRLEAERLLSQEAARRGYAGAAHTEQIARQALVQELLREAVEIDDVREAELAAAYAEQQARFERPETRRSTHLLAELRPQATSQQVDAARELIEHAIAKLGAAGAAPEAVVEALRHERPALFANVTTRVETLQAATATGPFVPEYSEALFSQPETGVVPRPVRTEFGYHAIVITEITPTVVTARTEAFATLRAELTTAKRKARLDALLRELQQRTPVRYGADTEGRLAQLGL